MTDEQIKRLQKIAAMLPRLTEERDMLIREAAESGTPVTHIARAANLHRTQVHRIIKEGAAR